MVMLPLLEPHADGLVEEVVIEGIGLTSMILVCLQPLLLVYVMVALPVFVPETAPLLSTETMLLFELLHAVGVAGVPSPVSVMPAPLQTLSGPLITGSALMVMTSVFLQPFRSS